MPNDMPNAMLGGQAAAPAPPSPEEVAKVLQQTSFVNAVLKEVLLQPKVERNDVFDAASTLVNAGAMTAQQAATQLADMPRNAEMIKPWLFMKWLTGEKAIEQLSDMLAGMGGAEIAQGTGEIALGADMTPAAEPPGNMLLGR